MTKDPMQPSEAPPPGAKAPAAPQPLFGDPANDWAALYEIADVIRKALRDPEFIRLANEPDTDKSSRVEGEDTPESAHMRCVAEEAINAVLNRIKIRSIKGNVVSMDVVAAGHSDDRAILAANLALSGVVARHRAGRSGLMDRE
jgi:predicted molibdopterin-dependent oxidoreductase YjgC